LRDVGQSGRRRQPLGRFGGADVTMAKERRIRAHHRLTPKRPNGGILRRSKLFALRPDRGDLFPCPLGVKLLWLVVALWWFAATDLEITAAGAARPQDWSAEPLIRMGVPGADNSRIAGDRVDAATARRPNLNRTGACTCQRVVFASRLAQLRAR